MADKDSAYNPDFVPPTPERNQEYRHLPPLPAVEDTEIVLSAREQAELEVRGIGSKLTEGILPKEGERDETLWEEAQHNQMLYSQLIALDLAEKNLASHPDDETLKGIRNRMAEEVKFTKARIRLAPPTEAS